ncbi:MAG: putative bifunctional diguanylate cyclase/phosphodiesterase, partial [Burkholderiaceae bacterium]
VQAAIASDGVAPALLFGDAKAAGETLRLLASSPDILQATVFDGAGHAFAEYDAGSRVSAAAPRPAADDPSLLDLRTPIVQGHERLGELRLLVSQQPLMRQTALLAGASILSALLGLVVSFMKVRRVRRAVARAEDDLNQLAFFDQVTGLRNRHAAMEMLSELALDPDTRFSVLLLDLDDFKLVNDTMGHAAGDALLGQLGAALQEAFKATGTVFRLGGDEFVAVVRSRRADETAVHLGRHTVACFDRPLLFRGRLMPVHASVGIAEFPDHGRTAQELLRAADTAMYRAKASGKNAFAVYDESMDREVVARMQLNEELAAALQRDQLVLHYQPILDLASEATIGVEALVRWNHPTRGLLAPGAFIEVAEGSGLIVELGGWVLNAAARQQAAWQAQGLGHLFIAVNVSAQQLSRRSLVDQVDAALRQSGADPRHLQIELTEHALVEDVAANVQMLATLRLRGMKIAIDDFGTGLSSLAYLKRLPIDKIKIDRSFVSDLGGCSEDLAIVEAIVGLARALNKEVVAEGIESRQQLAVLKALHAQHGQGFLFSRPVPPDEIASFVLRADRRTRADLPSA